MGLFNRKKAAEKVDQIAVKAEEKAAEVKQEAEAAVEKFAAAAEEKAAEVQETVGAAVVDLAAKAEEAVNGEEAPAEEAAREGAPSCGDPEGTNELTEKEKGTVYACRMNYHAGYNVYKEWPNGGMTIHAGIGWFHPFGPSEYYGMANIPGNFCEESKQFPLEKYFTRPICSASTACPTATSTPGTACSRCAASIRTSAWSTTPSTPARTFS